MKVLNLTSLANSDIKYKISKFPDGQNNIVILGLETTYLKKVSIESMINTNSPVTIKSRLNNFLDLELIIASVAGLRELGVKDIDLYTPYFMGARSDRKFEEGGNWYLRDVICPIINSLGFRYVTVLDPHSSVLGNLIKGFRSIDNKQLVEFSLKEIHKLSDESKAWKDQFILVSPDEGASKKIYKLAEQIGYKGDVITCSKERDIEGKLTKTVVPLNINYDNKDFIIIDDIGDGFGTFKNIAKIIRKDRNFSGKLYLIVTHSIQEHGIYSASDYFDGIYTTNSYKDWNIEMIKVLNVFLMELWKSIDFGTIYEVSNQGRVRSIDFYDSWNRLRKGRILKHTLDKGGYSRVRLSFNSMKCSFRVHRLVAKYFIPNPENKPQVNHIDGNKTNNNYLNLEYSTNSENQLHAIKTGLKITKVGKDSVRFKGSILVFDKSGKQIDELFGNIDMKNKGYDYRNISAVILGKRKTYKNLIFKRKN